VGPAVPCQRDPADAELLERFGPPSCYSLTAAELARHVRQLRRSGWQRWEVRARFEFWSAA
jgi:hypothetical protein